MAVLERPRRIQQRVGERASVDAAVVEVGRAGIVLVISTQAVAQPGEGLVIPAGTGTASCGTAPDTGIIAAAMNASHARSAAARPNERPSLKEDIHD